MVCTWRQCGLIYYFDHLTGDDVGHFENIHYITILITLAKRIFVHYIQYGDSADNTHEENFSIFLIRMCWLLTVRACGSKTLHQHNPLVLKWRSQLTQLDLYNDKMVVVVVY